MVTSTFMSLCFDWMTDRECLSRPFNWFGKTISKLSYPCSIFTACGEVKIHTKFSIVQIFVCRTSIWNIRKLAPYENFPLYGIVHLSQLAGCIVVYQFVSSTYCDEGRAENDYIPAHRTKMRQYKLVWWAGQEGSGVMPIHHLFSHSEECNSNKIATRYF